MAVNADFHSDFMINYNMLLPPMLADGVRIMIYIGMQVRTGLVVLRHSSARPDPDRLTALCAHQQQVAFQFSAHPVRITTSGSICFGYGAAAAATVS